MYTPLVPNFSASLNRFNTSIIHSFHPTFGYSQMDITGVIVGDTIGGSGKMSALKGFLRDTLYGSIF